MRIKAAEHNTAIAVRKECVSAACLCIKKRLNYPTLCHSHVSKTSRGAGISSGELLTSDGFPTTTATPAIRSQKPASPANL